MKWKPVRGDAQRNRTGFERFKVSQGTVRKAIDELATENLVIRRQGKGTFVATHHEALAQYRFLRLKPDVGLPRAGRKPFPGSEASKQGAGGSGTDSRNQVERPRSVHQAYPCRSKGRPPWSKRCGSPALIFKGLTAERLTEYKGPMYGLFESEFGTRMIRATEKIRAVCSR